MVDNEEQNEKTIKIGISQFSGDAPLVLAQEKFFKENNVKVELILTENVSIARKMYVDGDLDGMSDIWADTIFYSSRGYDPKIVFVLDYSASADALVSNQSDIINLKGKKIGVEGINTFSHIFVLQTLEKKGLFEKDVQFVDIPAQDICKALEERKIDAGHTWGPNKFNALQKGYKVLATGADVPGIITDVLVFNSEITEERPDDIQAIVKSVVQGREYLDNNREESLTILSNFLNMSQEELQDGFKGLHLLNLNDNIKAMQKSNETTSMYHSGEIIADFYLKNGQIRQVPDFDDIIVPKFVNSIASKK
jgi:NitT/TauT family transport system substrate-binding protein